VNGPVDEAPTFVCPACDKLHRRPEDVANRYCAVCRWWTGDFLLAFLRPDLFTAHGKPPPPDPLPQLPAGG
jgi:hypothetical protein